MSTHRKRPPRPSNKLPKNIFAVLAGDMSSLRATVGDLSRQIGSGSHATNEAARGGQGYVRKTPRIAEFTVRGEAMKPDVFEIGSRVRKVGGSYQANGTVRSTFLTRYGQRRYVLDFDTPAGLLHIFSHDQLEPLDV